MKEWKAAEKEAQKMTRDGAISVNMVTGEASHVSDRAPEQDYSPSGDSTAFVHSAAERLDDRRIHKSEKKKRRKRRRSYREGTAASDCPSSRLQFTDEERAAPELQKAIRKSDKAADKLDAARAAIPEKQPSFHQPVNPLARPLQEIGHAAHAKVHEVEQENVGVEAGHMTERGMEKAVRYGNRKLQNWQTDRKLKPWREVSHAEQAAVQANAEALYQKALRENPQLAASNPISRMWQKKKLQKQYAAAYRAAHSAGDAAAAAQTASKGARKSADAAKKAGEFVSKHKKAFLIVGGIGLLLVMLLGLLQSCSSIFGGGVSNIVASSYLSEDADLLAAEAAYCAMEDELREYLDTYEQTHDYDEYHFDLDEIKHDPYVLLSILSALHEGQFPIDQVQGDLQMLFDKQYILTETVTTETRYRTETRTDSEGNEYEVEVPYTYYICTVELENFDLSHVPVYIMDTETLSMYAVYMSTLGNRSDLFPSSWYVDKYITTPPEDYEIPAEYLSDERFAALITEAEKYLGYGYIKDPNDSKHWIVDDEAAQVVRRVYSMTLEGFGTEQIAAQLEKDDVLTPRAYWLTKGIKRPGKGKQQPPTKWNSSTITKILSLQEYCGDILNFKTYSKSYKNKKRIDNDRENWVVFQDVHEAIIERAVYEQVQQKRGKIRKRRTNNGEHNMFSGLLVCADCGSNLHFHFNQGNPEIKYFNCSNYKGNRGTCTSTHYVRVDFLEEVVLGEIRRLTKFASLYEDEFVKAVIGHSQQAEQTDRKLKEKELKTLLARDEELDDLFERIYEDNVSGKLSDDRFAKMSRRYEDEQKELAEKIKKLRSEIEKQSSRSMTTDMFIGLVRKYTRARKLTPRMLNELVEKIEVFNAEKIDGVWEQRLRIHYNCVGTIEIPTVLPLPIPEVSVNTRKGVVVNYAPCELAV